MRRFVLVAIVSTVGLVLTSAAPRPREFGGQTLLPNESVVRTMGRSHRSLVTDLYWIRTIATSIQMKSPAAGRVLIEWCAFVSHLDPRFVWPYVMGGLLGPMREGDTDYNVDRATELLAAGTVAIPEDYRLAIYLAFNQLRLQHDPLAAARTMETGSRAPGAPDFMRQLATRLYAQAGEYETARTLASEMAQAPDSETRTFFENRLKEIDRDAAIDVVQQAVDTFKERHGSIPTEPETLVSEGLLPQLPAEPFGGTYRIAPDTGRVTSTSGSRLQDHRNWDD